MLLRRVDPKCTAPCGVSGKHLIKSLLGAEIFVYGQNGLAVEPFINQNILKIMLVTIVLDRRPTPSFTHVVHPYSQSFLRFLQQCRSTLFCLLDSVIGVIIFNIWDSTFKFSGKKYSFAVTNSNWIMMIM